MKKLLMNTCFILITTISIFIIIPSSFALDIAIPAVKARGSELYSPQTAWDLGYNGSGIGVAVIDGGVDDDHPDLSGKFIGGVDFTQPPSPFAPRDGSYNPDDMGGHGTMCAGCVMGDGNESDGKYMGGAPRAGLIDIKVYRSLKPGGSVRSIIVNSPQNIIQAFQWAVVHKDDFNIRIISISIATSPRNSNGSDPLSEAANNAVKAGIVVVSAAGNDGPDNSGFYAIPAADGVITVGAVDDKGTISRDDDEIASFSNRGPRADDGDDNPYDELKPDVVAPGVDITSLSHSMSPLPPHGYTQESGTSFSAPIVGGVVALMLQANPSLTPAQVKDILHRTAESRGSPDHPSYPFPYNKWNRSYGFGIVDAYKAVKTALEMGGGNISTPLSPPHLSSIPSPDDDGNYVLHWTPVENTTKYLLEEDSLSYFPSPKEIYRGNCTSFAITGRGNGTYYYRVKALSEAQESPWSNTESVVVRIKTNENSSGGGNQTNNTGGGNQTGDGGAEGETGAGRTGPESTGKNTWTTEIYAVLILIAVAFSALLLRRKRK